MVMVHFDCLYYLYFVVAVFCLSACLTAHLAIISFPVFCLRLFDFPVVYSLAFAHFCSLDLILFCFHLFVCLFRCLFLLAFVVTVVCLFVCLFHCSFIWLFCFLFDFGVTSFVLLALYITHMHMHTSYARMLTYRSCARGRGVV